MKSKVCNMCGEDKPVTSFHRTSTSYGPYCKPCHKERMRDGHRLRRYGVSPSEFSKMAISQNLECAICSDPLDIEGGKYAVDHNHTTGSARGILCKYCNSGIGYLKDNPDVLRAAAAYLEQRGYYGE